MTANVNNRGNNQNGGNQSGGGSGGSNRSQGSDQNQSGNDQGGGSQGEGRQNSNDANIEGWQPGQVGEVKNPDQDGRLYENRMEGKTLGTTEHSKKAPHSIKDGTEFSDEDSNDFNNQGGDNR